VLLDVRLYEELVDEVAHLRDLAAAETQLDAGMVVPHEGSRRVSGSNSLSGFNRR